MHRTLVPLLALLLALPAAAAAKPNKKVCGDTATGYAHCNSRVITDAKGNPEVTTAPRGYGPADLQAAYTFPSSSAGIGKTFAIVDAYDDPTAAADLSTYRSKFALPTCGTGCFQKVNQNGTSSPLPRANGGWAQEISLDLDMASAVCPNCKILLVEANSNSFTDLAAAEDTAARLGASVISNSYGGNEFSQETSATYNSHFDHPDVAITVSTGDSGYGVEFPAASQYVTAVGGTSLAKSGSTTFSEKAWSGAGSGCSAYVGKPSWQTDSGCSKRTVADVSAVADPNTGVAVYDSYRYQGAAGWMVFGGTSASAPIIAGAYALGGHSSASTAYNNTAALHDVTSGSNGSCTVKYLCTAGPGFDGPTGLGTPSGVAAF